MASPQFTKTMKYYWAVNKRLYLAGFEPEEWRNSKQLAHGDRALRFFNHLFATDERKKQKFIEESKPFKEGIIREITKDTYDSIQAKGSMGNVPKPMVVEAATSAPIIPPPQNMVTEEAEQQASV
jgi:hypothetical protein